MGMESFIFKSKKPDINTIENIEKTGELIFPHGEFGIKEYEKEYGNNPEEINKVRDIFNTFLSQEISNVQIYNSQKYGVSFPYTSININNFSKEIYEKYTGKKPSIKILEDISNKSDGKKNISYEYIFPGAPLNADLVDNGPFHFAGESMHQCIGKLPAALEKIKNGEEPDNFEIFMLGTPTNEYGTMSTEFLEKFEKNPTSVMSEVFAEFIEKNNTEKNSENNNLSTELYGVSWGGGLSALTGEKLLESDTYTQNQEEKNDKELIIIRAQNPVSLSRSKIKGLKIWLGSPLNDLVSGDKYGPTMGKENPKFMEQIRSLLKERGIITNISEEQQKMKKKAMLDIILAFRKEVKLKPETKVNEIYGLNDLSTKTSSLNNEVEEQIKSHGGSLGQNIAIPRRENSRVFGVNSFHEIPWFRKNELKRIHKAVEVINNLENT
jgi:hypothetical protein